MESNITLIACVDRNNGIGKDDKLLYHLPEDLKFFRETTEDSIVVMGRSTYDSIGRPLKNRVNVVISRSYTFAEKFELFERGVLVVDDMRSLKTFLNIHDTGKEVFIIGGQSIYEQFMESADRLIITEVEGEKEADKFFPKIHKDEWKVYKTKTLSDRATVKYYHPI